jgi:hypothetical protein
MLLQIFIENNRHLIEDQNIYSTVCLRILNDTDHKTFHSWTSFVYIDFEETVLLNKFQWGGHRVIYIINVWSYYKRRGSARFGVLIDTLAIWMLICMCWLQIWVCDVTWWLFHHLNGHNTVLNQGSAVLSAVVSSSPKIFEWSGHS